MLTTGTLVCLGLMERITLTGQLISILITLKVTIQKKQNHIIGDINKKWECMENNKITDGYKEVPSIRTGSCLGCQFRHHLTGDKCFNRQHCIEHNCVLRKEDITRKNCWETISDFFEEWNCDNTHNGDDMVAVAQDAIVADNKYLAFQIEDLMNLEPEEFKKECQQLLKQFQ